MTSKVFLLFLLSCSLCAGQSVLTTPVGVTQSVPANATAPTSGNAQAPMQRSDRSGVYPNSNATAPVTQTGATQEVLTPLPNSARFVGPLLTKSEFQRFAEDATGRPLPVYGRQLFDEVPTTFAPLQNVPVPADYVLGPGDTARAVAQGDHQENRRQDYHQESLRQGRPDA